MPVFDAMRPIAIVARAEPAVLVLSLPKHKPGKVSFNFITISIPVYAGAAMVMIGISIISSQ